MCHQMFLVLLVTLSSILAAASANSSDCHEHFMKFLNDSIQRQADKLMVAPYACSNPEILALAPGSQPQHWPAMRILLRKLFYDAGDMFPNGIMFTPEIGGLPAPTGPARAYYAHALKDMLTEMGEFRLNICSREGIKTLVSWLQGDYEENKDDFKEYAEQNCDALKNLGNSTSRARNLFAIGSQAVIEGIPEMASLVPDISARLALAEIVITFNIDADTVTLV